MIISGHEIRPEDIGLVTVKAEDEIQPFMVTFLKANNHVKVRATRSTNTKKDVSLPGSFQSSKFFNIFET